MAHKILRTPRARQDLLEIWLYVADDKPSAADKLLDRFESVLRTLRDNPQLGRARPELADALRSMAVGRYILFYRPVSNGIELVRVRSGYMDIQPDDMA